MANDGSTRAAEKKREKTLGIKAFFGLGRHSRHFNMPTECAAPSRNQAL
ncbi:hypothetical protein G9Q84_17685 [Pseudomonas sp. P7]|nr:MULTISPECIES: hypothetical protein [Pseudomonas]MBA2924715.1 hypothetical protein [Pseudomonas sivasensis]MCT4499400.1 hypothetical protein [Pseudomonas sivasensis]